MAIVIYKYAYHVGWNSSGVAVSGGGSGTNTSCDLSNYYTKTELQGYRTARIHYSNIVYDGRITGIIYGTTSLIGHLGSATPGRLRANTYGTSIVTGNMPIQFGMSVTFDMSIEQDSEDIVTLVGDEESPGNSQLYGTNSSGVKGWYDIPTSGTPTAHHLTHENDGADEISVAGLSGVLADAQTPIAHDLTSAYHTDSGLTTGHFLKATAATTFAWGVHGLTYTDVGAAATSHAHGNITSAGAIGSTSGLPVVTTTSGALTTGTYGLSFIGNGSAQYQIPVTGTTPFTPTWITATNLIGANGLNALTYASLSFVKMSAAGTFSLDTSTYLTSVTSHNLLSATHGDTSAGTVVRGDIIYGNSTPAWAKLAFPASPTGKVIQATATDVAWSTNAITIGTSASISGSNTGDVSLATNHGLSLSSQVIGMGTPSSITTTSTNSVTTTTHTHAITAAIGLIGNGSAQYQIPVTGATPFTPTWTTATNLVGANGLNALTYASLSFVKMSATGTFTLDTATYLTALPSHAHGNITNTGYLGSTSSIPLITGTAGIIQAGSFGSTTGTFCQGDDSRLSNSRTPTAHQLDSATYHTVSGLTTGHFLKATGATSFAWGAHGLTYTDVGAQQSNTNLTALAGLVYNSTSFVKMTAAGTFALDTTLYSSTSHDHSGTYIPIVSTPTTGNFPILTAGGALNNSTYSYSSFATAGHNHSGVYEPADAGLTSLAGLTYASTSFVKMTGANTFTLDTASYVNYSGTPANNQVALFTDIDTITGNSALTYDGSTLTVGNAISVSSVTSTGSLSLIPTSGAFIYLGGTGYTSGDIFVQAAGNSTNINLSFSAKGSGSLIFTSTSGGVSFDTTGTITFQGSDVWIGSSTTYTGTFTGAQVVNHKGMDVTISAGTAISAGYDGGDLFLYGGFPGSGGDWGNIYLGDGSAGYLPAKTTETNVIYYNASTGLLSYGSVGTGAGTVDYSGTPVDNQIAVWVDTNTIEGTSGLTYNGTALSVSGTVTSTGDMTATNFCQSSDIRQKTNVNCYCKAPKLNIDYQTFELKNAPGIIRYGAIAQEVQKEYPELVREDADGMLSIAYIDLLVREVAYLKRKVHELQDIFDCE